MDCGFEQRCISASLLKHTPENSVGERFTTKTFFPHVGKNHSRLKYVFCFFFPFLVLLKVLSLFVLFSTKLMLISSLRLSILSVNVSLHIGHWPFADR